MAITCAQQESSTQEHSSAPESRPCDVNGDVVTTRVTAAAPHHLLADDGVLSYRATRAGDRHEEGRKPETPPIGVGLGLPTLRRETAPAATIEKGCPT